MKRFHVHLGVADLDRSIRFYTDLFGNEPAMRKPDYTSKGGVLHAGRDSLLRWRECPSVDSGLVLFADDGEIRRRERLLRTGNREFGRGVLRIGGARRLIPQSTCSVIAAPGAQCPSRCRKSARKAIR